jgi:DNA (cytosine-5)-methyltransferase 1
VRIGGLFEGMGGLTRGVQDAMGGDLAWYSEIDPAASRVLAHHHPGVPNLGDITTVDWAAVEPVDVLTGGFPCQDVSPAGKRAGMKPGTRSGLWSHMAYAISQLRPSLVVIENVRGLLTARGAPPTEELLAAWDERDRCDRTLTYLAYAYDRALRSNSKGFLHRVQAARFRYLGRRRRAVAAAKRADALIVRAIGTVLGDLAELGFDAEWVSLPAAGVGCCHLRWRVFVVAANANDFGSVRAGNSWRMGAGSADHDLASADTAGAGRRQSGGVTPGQAQGAERQGGWPAGRGSGAPPADTDRRGRGGDSGHTRRHQVGRTAPDGPRPPSVDWGDYEPAICQWAAILGRPAPAPTVAGARSGRVLNPVFVEWMQGLPAGHVTGVEGLSRNDQLKILGNGVVPQQAAAAVRYLLPLLQAGERAA